MMVNTIILANQALINLLSLEVYVYLAKLVHIARDRRPDS
jgi:hypothetical protein